MKKAMVFFDNGCKAQFDLEKVLFLRRDGGLNVLQKSLEAVPDVIVWDSISFIRLIEEKKEEDG